MNIKPIRTDADHKNALRRVEALWRAPKSSKRADELDVLIPLIQAYEREHYPIDTPDPIKAIRFRLEQLGRDELSLVGIIGQRPRVYEVMAGIRPLSINMIRRLHARLGIPAESLIRRPRLNPESYYRRPSSNRSSKRSSRRSKRKSG
jgi:HTH-type transcriptional regulator / antitoxin HigA